MCGHLDKTSNLKDYDYAHREGNGSTEKAANSSQLIQPDNDPAGMWSRQTDLDLTMTQYWPTSGFLVGISSAFLIIQNDQVAGEFKMVHLTNGDMVLNNIWVQSGRDELGDWDWHMCTIDTMHETDN